MKGNLGGRVRGYGRECKTLTDAQAGYLAGIIDGEGTIGIAYRRPCVKYPFGTVEFDVHVSMSNPVVLDWIIEVTGLGCRNRKGYRYRSTDGKHCSTFTWAVRGSSMVSLLRRIAPYLVLKDANAAAIFRLHSELLVDSHLHRDSEWVSEVREHFRKLNGRGVGAWETKFEARIDESMMGAKLRRWG